MWSSGSLTQESVFFFLLLLLLVEHPNILFGQHAVLRWSPRFPFTEFMEREVFKKNTKSKEGSAFPSFFPINRFLIVPINGSTGG